jgi:hypothetical protein
MIFVLFYADKQASWRLITVELTPIAWSFCQYPLRRWCCFTHTNTREPSDLPQKPEQLTNPVPEFEAAPRLTMLPGGLHWSAQQPVPAVGATVTVNRDGHQERAEVKGYTHAAGFLGLVTETTHHAKTASRRKRSSPRAGVVFGSQLAFAA